MDSHDENATIYADNATLYRQLEKLFAFTKPSQNDEPQETAMVVKGRS